MATGRYGKAYTASDFFTEGYPSLQDCIKFLDPQNVRDIEAKPSPGIAQGAHSYSVRIGYSSFAQFRKSSDRLDHETLQLAHEKYGTLGPRKMTESVLANLWVYEMRYKGGYSLHKAMQLWGYGVPLPTSPYYSPLRETGLIPGRLQASVESFARHVLVLSLFCSAGRITPSPETPVDYTTHDKYVAALNKLSHILPERFHEVIELLKTNLATLYASDWPQAVNNLGLCPAVLKVDLETGELKSCSSWSHVSVGPFGITVSSLEHLLGGIDDHGNWVHVHHHEQLRMAFTYTLTVGQYWGKDIRLGYARMLGSFFNFKNGFGNLLLNETYDMDACSHRIAFLDAVVLEPMARMSTIPIETRRQYELALQNMHDGVNYSY
ncbi:hypothetical protein NLG97_g6999 [Lecanicillium saksenae]|uniref:Uncharacterized protein n=1 Tax=Lecanicillium saksenae TaxID=468837 RepID=A0ACC1QRW1_9HYPO|nr:hypothetical protein NLG97_g6999 [Lecanicillium saksenae]